MEVKEPNVKYLSAQFKRTEAGDIPIDWLDKTVGDMAEVTSGGTPSRKVAAYWDGDIPWVTTAELECGQVTSAAQHITLAGLQNSAAKWLPAGTLLIALYGQGKTRGKCAVLRIAATTNQACAGIKLEEGVDGDFVRHNLTHRYEYIRSLSNGGSQENLSGEIVKKIHIGMPSTPTEQRAIAAALTDADSLIDSLEQLLTKKRQIKQGAMQELLTGKRRLPGFEQAWTICTLGGIATITMGRTPARLVGSYWGSGHKWLSIADLKGKVIVESKEEITDAGAEGMEPIPEGTLLMSFKLTIGRLAFAGCELYTNEAICALRSPQVDSELLYYALSRVDFSLFGKQAVKGYTLNKESLHNVEVLLPSEPEEQRAIAQVLASVDNEIIALESRLTKARALKQAMAQALLTGRIRLMEPTK